jgi:hypothetical protein
MLFSALLRSHGSLTPKERLELVDAVIQVLHLKHIEHSVIGDETTRGVFFFCYSFFFFLLSSSQLTD